MANPLRSLTARITLLVFVASVLCSLAVSTLAIQWAVDVDSVEAPEALPLVRSIGPIAALNCVIVLCVSFIASRIAGSIVKPLRALSSAAKRLSLGEREVEIVESASATDEIRVLTQSFNEMSRGLDRSTQQLEENQREIETTNQELIAKNEELSNMNQVLAQLSITDGLTKLHNHRYFQDAIISECKRSARTGDPLCLVLIDIDGFKGWNDRLGHASGDLILQRVAEVLHQSVRETDLLARYGGEEFALLAINTALPGATALGDKVREAVESADFMTDLPSEKAALTVSVGVAEFRGDRAKLFEDADQALYSAKAAGRNRVIVAS